MVGFTRAGRKWLQLCMLETLLTVRGYYIDPHVAKMIAKSLKAIVCLWLLYVYTLVGGTGPGCFWVRGGEPLRLGRGLVALVAVGRWHWLALAGTWCGPRPVLAGFAVVGVTIASCMMGIALESWAGPENFLADTQEHVTAHAHSSEVWDGQRVGSCMGWHAMNSPKAPTTF